MENKLEWSFSNICLSPGGILPCFLSESLSLRLLPHPALFLKFLNPFTYTFNLGGDVHLNITVALTEEDLHLRHDYTIY